MGSQAAVMEEAVQQSWATVMEEEAMVASLSTHWSIISEQSYLDHWKALPFL